MCIRKFWGANDRLPWFFCALIVVIIKANIQCQALFLALLISYFFSKTTL